MISRAFGAVHTNISLLTLRSVLLDRDTRVVLGLNIASEFGDLVATLLESWDGDLRRGEAFASVALQCTSMATVATALRAYEATSGAD